MRIRTFGALIVLLGLLVSPLAVAQATRTRVSGVGDDANPCSRTAPCKTFAGAISKTAAGGEINVLDPGGFGAVTITKAITIEGDHFIAGVLVSGTNGIVVAAGPSDVVTLRNLDIDGLGTGINGIQFISGGDLHVENCQIYGFAQQGILFQPSANSSLFVVNTTLRNNAGGAIYIRPTSTGSAFAKLDHVLMNGNFRGVRAEDASDVVVQDSTASNNNFIGYIATAGARPATMTIERSTSTQNGSAGVTAGANSSVYLSNSTVMRNVYGLQALGGSLYSFGNNRVTGNLVDNGAPSATLGQM
jgi:hypothetical protein